MAAATGARGHFIKGDLLGGATAKKSDQILLELRARLRSPLAGLTFSKAANTAYRQRSGFSYA